MKRKQRTSFYWYLSLVFLLILFIGFGPQLFWRPLTERPSLSLLSSIHAVFAVCWVVFYSIQIFFIKSNRTLNHRKFGVWVALVGVGLIVSNFGMIYKVLQDYLETNEAFMNPIGLTIGNAIATIFFAVFVGLGMVYRSQPMLHRQFMTVGTIFMLGPAIGRLSRYPLTRVLDDFGANEALWAVGGASLLFIVLIIFGKKKWVSVMGFGAYILTLVVLGFLMESGIGMRGIESMR